MEKLNKIQVLFGKYYLGIGLVGVIAYGVFKLLNDY